MTTARPSQVIDQLRTDGALTAPYGPPESAVEVVQTFGELDQEYAALRKGAGLFDNTMLGCVAISGADRIDFLNRMLTQELKGFAPYRTADSFWLSRKGRIDADVRLVALPDRVLAFVDVHAAERLRTGLAAYVIMEDVELMDESGARHAFGLHGPAARAVLLDAVTPGSVRGAAGGIETLAQGEAVECEIESAPAVAFRADLVGEVGIHVSVRSADAGMVYAALRRRSGQLLHGAEDDAFRRGPDPFGLRTVGWAAINTARVEAGTPLYLLDFGTDSLAHETGVLNERVSFTKGCYLGQEIVARMQSLGAPKKRLMGIRLETVRRGGTVQPTDAMEAAEAEFALQPETGSAVFAAPAAGATVSAETIGEPVGGVTSSAISPMLGGAPVCFAMVKTAQAVPDTRLLVEAEGRLIAGVVQPRLSSLRVP
ncbi:MAG: CAF17-like 4Fe-4S cluster assembly/insertion protein YgfZ [Phycisphaerales bacterium]